MKRVLEKVSLIDEQSIKLNDVALNVAQGLQRGALEPFWLTCVAVCIDFPVFVLAFWFALYGASSAETFAPFIAIGWAGLGSLTFVTTMVATGAYRSSVIASWVSFVARTVLCLFVPVAALIFLPSVDSIAVSLSVAAISFTIATVPSRLGAQIAVKWVIESGLISRRAIIAGGGEEAARLIRGLNERQDNDVRLFGIFDDRDDNRSPTQILGIPKIGSYGDLVAFVRSSEIDLVIIALPFAAEDRIKWLLDEFRVLPVEVRLSIYSKDYAFEQNNQAFHFGRHRRIFSPERRLTKRLFDIFFASLALAIFWPILILAALAVRLESPGSVIFRQNRHGYNNRVIEVLKFRSMYSDVSDSAAKEVVTRGDARVTRVGRFLRRSSIDELPQLFNVLRGDLSLVGPRPHAVVAFSSQQERFTQIVDGYSARHRLPPGITGWAQINGWRGEIDDAEKLKARFEHDLFYIENWSFWLDLKILLQTPASLFRSKGAY
jgi:Undecaprenyl-phosphate glucose phosphotransferase